MCSSCYNKFYYLFLRLLIMIMHIVFIIPICWLSSFYNVRASHKLPFFIVFATNRCTSWLFWFFLFGYLVFFYILTFSLLWYANLFSRCTSTRNREQQVITKSFCDFPTPLFPQIPKLCISVSPCPTIKVKYHYLVIVYIYNIIELECPY